MEPPNVANFASEPAGGLNENVPSGQVPGGSAGESIRSTALAVESAMETALRRAEIRAREACERWREDIRKSPAQAVLIAAAAGYVCNRLPMRSLFVSGIRIFSAFTPPTLVALGICKVAEYWKRRKTESSRRLSQKPGPVSEAVIVVTDA